MRFLIESTAAVEVYVDDFKDEIEEHYEAQLEDISENEIKDYFTEFADDIITSNDIDFNDVRIKRSDKAETPA